MKSNFFLPSYYLCIILTELLTMDFEACLSIIPFEGLNVKNVRI